MQVLLLCADHAVRGWYQFDGQLAGVQQCAAHLLRHLQGVWELHPDWQQWAQVQQVLREANTAVTQAAADGRGPLDPDLLADPRRRYDEAVGWGQITNRHRAWDGGTNHPGYTLARRLATRRRGPAPGPERGRTTKMARRAWHLKDRSAGLGTAMTSPGAVSASSPRCRQVAALDPPSRDFADPLVVRGELFGSARKLCVTCWPVARHAHAPARSGPTAGRSSTTRPRSCRSSATCHCP